MQYYLSHVIVLIKRLLLLLLVFSLMRLFYFIVNFNIFNEGFITNLSYFFFGIRFDYSAIIYLNSWFIIISLLPLPFIYGKIPQRIIKILFLFFNSSLILSDLSDAVFFRFSFKRSTADVFDMSTSVNDMVDLLPKYIADFWYVFAVWIVLTILLIKLYPNLRKETVKFQTTIKIFLLQFVLSILIITAFYIPARGIGLKPVRVISASSYVAPENMSIILNTPFCIVTTFYKEELPQISYTDIKDDSQFSALKDYKSETKFIKPNIVIIILESFGKEYIGTYNSYKGHTPFIDTLISNGLSCSNAYANGKRSIEGIPAVIASIPSLMSNAFIASQFTTNQINSIGSLLAKETYHTSFFHGGKNGTMGFDKFCKLAGIEHYYGMSEYPHDSDYDGDWGIYDDKFYNFYHNKLNEFPEPFFSTFFSLSSHHPYNVPPELTNKFSKGSLPIHNSIEYADYSLKLFFNSIKDEPWFKNTIFIITADHTSQSNVRKYQTKTGTYSIPLIFYKPNDSFFKGIINERVSQVDIMPSLFDYINYPNKFISFGNSIFNNNEEHFVITFRNGLYQFIYNNDALYFDGDNYKAMYKLSEDTLMQRNHIKTYTVPTEYNDILKTYILQYNSRLRNNKMIIDDSEKR